MRNALRFPVAAKATVEQRAPDYGIAARISHMHKEGR